MNHPPIPPNCDLKMDDFEDDIFRIVWRTQDKRGTSFVPRRMIAAVARCAWLEEAEKWAKLPVNDCKNFDSIAAFKAEAEANAEAWRKWGME